VLRCYDDKTSLMVCCPLTTQIKNHPFEVKLAGNLASVVLADQVKSVDWRARKAVRGKARLLRRRWPRFERRFEH